MQGPRHDPHPAAPHAARHATPPTPPPYATRDATARPFQLHRPAQPLRVQSPHRDLPLRASLAPPCCVQVCTVLHPLHRVRRSIPPAARRLSPLWPLHAVCARLPLFPSATAIQTRSPHKALATYAKRSGPHLSLFEIAILGQGRICARLGPRPLSPSSSTNLELRCRLVHRR